MNKLFLIACFLIPFENFWFAPSSGWATIAPIVFFIYVMLNFKYAIRSLEKNSFLIVILIYGLLITLVNYLFMEAKIGNLVDTLISVALGISFYFAIDIYFVQKGKQVETIVNYLVIAYSLSMFIGIFEFLVVRLGSIDGIRLIMMLSKRNYIQYGRVQFTFTEPSFIGMHIYGVLFPIYVLTRDKKIKYIMILYIFLAIVMGCSARVVFDTAVFMIIFLFYKIDLKKAKNIFIVCSIVVSIIMGGLYIYNANYRIRMIVNQGIYADGSLATRWFRINASLKGYQKNKLHTLIGYGYGNAIVPLRDGFVEARGEYKNPNTWEINGLINPNISSDSVAYCLYTRWISELGLIGFLSIVFYFLKYWRKVPDGGMKIYFWLVCYLYIQFDSYAFYSLWIMLLLFRNSRFAMLGKKEIEDER